MRDCRLECVQAVIERQKRMPAEDNDDRLFLDRQHRRSRFLWSRPSVHDRAARLPLAHRLLIDAVTSGERSQALFTMLYRSTDRLSRRGAPVKNLAHSDVLAMDNRIVVITSSGDVYTHTVDGNVVSPAIRLAGPAVAARPEDRRVLVMDQRLLVVTQYGSLFAHRVDGDTIEPAIQLAGPPVASRARCRNK